MTESFPAPWSLRGRGHVFLYRFSREFLAQESVMPAALRASFVGGLGALMIVDYSESNCGPYRELLLIPGSRLIQGRVRPSISRILVSTSASVTNGRRNWGIPKEQADFQIVTSDGGCEQWLVRQGGQTAFHARVRPTWFGLPLPLHTAFIPHTIAQSWEDQVFITKVSAHGWARPARLVVQQTAGQIFPDLSRERPLFSLGARANPFSMTFHQATMTNASTPR